jgi:hypothetical protein
MKSAQALVIMQLLGFLAVLLSLLAIVPESTAKPTAVNYLAAPYAGIKVLRVPTGPSTEALKELEDLIESLQLESWTTVPRVNSHVDLQVPVDQYEDFMTAAHKIVANSGARGAGVDIEVMHEDLATSIEEETQGMYNPVRDEKGTSTLVL